MATPKQVRGLWALNDALQSQLGGGKLNPLYHPLSDKWWKQAMNTAAQEEGKSPKPWDRPLRAKRRKELYEDQKAQGGYYTEERKKLLKLSHEGFTTAGPE